PGHLPNTCQTVTNISERERTLMNAKKIYATKSETGESPPLVGSFAETRTDGPSPSSRLNDSLNCSFPCATLSPCHHNPIHRPFCKLHFRSGGRKSCSRPWSSACSRSWRIVASLAR